LIQTVWNPYVWHLKSIRCPRARRLLRVANVGFTKTWEERMQAEYTPSFDEKNRRPGYFAAFVLDPDGKHIEAA
jgi:hypothetical protein